jgi:hypothetical protein
MAWFYCRDERVQIIEATYKNGIRIDLEGRFSRNSLFFSLLAGKTPTGDRSDQDCLHRQLSQAFINLKRNLDARSGCSYRACSHGVS